MRTLYFTKAEKSVLKFLSDIYELGREIKISKDNKDYIINSYYISKALLAKSVGLHSQTITNAIIGLSDKKIIKYESIIVNNSVQGSILYFNSDFYLHPDLINELSGVLDSLDIDTWNNELSNRKIGTAQINNLLSDKYKELPDMEEFTEDVKEDIKENIKTNKENIKTNKDDITILYKMFLRQNKAIMKSLDLIAEQNKVFAEQNKAVVKSLDLLSNVINKLGSVGTYNQVVDKTILNNPKVDNEPQFAVVNKEVEDEFITEELENNMPNEIAENNEINEINENNENGLITIRNEKETINSKEVITVEAQCSIEDTGPDIDVYLYENDEEYAKEVAGIKDRDNITYEDLDYFRYLKNISNNFYHRFFDKIGNNNYNYGLSYAAGLFAYRLSISNQYDELMEHFTHIDRDGWVTYMLVQEDAAVRNIIKDLPIQPLNITVGELGLVLNYSEDIPNISEPYKYKIKFDFIYRTFNDIREIQKKAKEPFNSYELLGIPVSLGISEDMAAAFEFEMKYYKYDLDYAKKHILLKLFYISLKRSQTERAGDFRIGRNSYYIGEDNKLVMHKATWLIINKVDYQPFVKQLLIDYTEWCCGGGDKWVEEIEKYIIPKKRISTRRVYNGLDNGLPSYDIEYIESELLDGHLIRRIYDKMVCGKYRAGFTLGLDEAGLGKASKRDIPNYKTDTKEYEDLFYRFIGLVKTGFGYCSMNGIKPIAKNDFEYYKAIAEERVSAIVSRGICRSMTSEEYKEKDLKKRCRIWNKYKQSLVNELSYDDIMFTKDFIEDEEDLNSEEKEFLQFYPTLLLKIIKNTQFRFYSKTTLLKGVLEKLDLLRKELRGNGDEATEVKDGRLGLKSEMDIKRIANNLKENLKNYI